MSTVIEDEDKKTEDKKPLNPLIKAGIWVVVSVLGAVAFAVLAFVRGDSGQVNAIWMVIAALCTYAVGYRFYSKFIAWKIMQLDNKRATPAVLVNNGRDYVPTNKYVLLGHHFAAIAGAGPLVGPVLAAQFGFLPGTIWIIVGVVLAGAVQDFCVLFISMRRKGRSLGQMAKDEISGFAGWIALFAILFIMVLLLAVLALVVVNALAESPWGFTTIALTIPIALLMGFWMKVLRPGKILEASVIGVVLMLLGVFVGKWVADSDLAKYVTLDKNMLVLLLVLYGFIASVLPVWVLLAPRDYLSTFMKIGVVALLALATIFLMPNINMPAVNGEYAWKGLGPVVPGNLFPFVFITIACGAISGFHSLVSSGTTPKMIPRESDARMIGYGGMLMESFVAVIAMVAAVTLSPGVYFAMNTNLTVDQISGRTPVAAGAVDPMGNYHVAITKAEMDNLAKEVGEKTLMARTGGAPTLAVGMAQIISKSLGGGLMDVWYHFAIMFEALFILTTIDAGTRIGRFMLQDLGGHFWKPLGRTSWYPGVIITSAIIVGLWGGMLWMGVNDPNGGIKSLWALFGIANQMLAAIALSTVTTVFIKMGKVKYIWVTLVPMAWLITTTFSAAVMRILDGDVRIGFLALADKTQAKIDAGGLTGKALSDAQTTVFNNRFDAVIGVILIVVVSLIVIESVRQWYLLLTHKKQWTLTEEPRVELNPELERNLVGTGASVH